MVGLPRGAQGERRKRADADAVAGRRYVQAYVELMHYLERVNTDEER